MEAMRQFENEIMVLKVIKRLHNSKGNMSQNYKKPYLFYFENFLLANHLFRISPIAYKWDS